MTSTNLILWVMPNICYLNQHLQTIIVIMIMSKHVCMRKSHCTLHGNKLIAFECAGRKCLGNILMLYMYVFSQFRIKRKRKSSIGKLSDPIFSLAVSKNTAYTLCVRSGLSYFQHKNAQIKFHILLLLVENGGFERWHIYPVTVTACWSINYNLLTIFPT